jgi:hypothetical protein
VIRFINEAPGFINDKGVGKSYPWIWSQFEVSRYESHKERVLGVFLGNGGIQLQTPKTMNKGREIHYKVNIF